MQLKTLIVAISVREIIGPVDRAVESIAYDSRRVQRNGLFVALRGEKSDGHDFIGQAIEKGAAVIVTERAEKNSRATFVVVENTRAAMADLAARFYNYPARKLKLAGVTGTNGKTTTTFLIKHICEKAGMRCGLLGTVRYEIGERVLPAARTTPESLDLQELLAQIRDAGCRAAAMEVSSHALAQDRTRDIEWDALCSQISLRTISIITEQWRIISKPSRNCSSNSPTSSARKSRSRLSTSTTATAKNWSGRSTTRFQS